MYWYGMKCLQSYFNYAKGVKLWKRAIQLKYEALDVNKRLHIYMPV